MPCVKMIPDQNVKKADADVTNSNVSQSHAVTILTVTMVKSVLVNVVIIQISMVPILPTVKNQIHVSKLIAKVTTTVAKRNDVILTNVFQFNADLKSIADHRNSAKILSVKRLNAVIIPIAKVSFLIQPLHTNVYNKNVSPLNVLLLLTAVKEVSAIKPPIHATNQSAWDMPAVKKLLVAKMVPAVANSKQTKMVPTLVTNVSRSNAEPTITVQKQKNSVIMKPTNVKRLIAHLILTVIKRMVIKNVLPTSVKRLVASPIHIAATWLSVKLTNVSLFNARPTAIAHLVQSVETKNVSQLAVQIIPTVMILPSHTVREISVFQCQESWTLSTKLTI